MFVILIRSRIDIVWLVKNVVLCIPNEKENKHTRGLLAGSDTIRVASLLTRHAWEFGKFGGVEIESQAGLKNVHLTTEELVKIN